MHCPARLTTKAVELGAGENCVLTQAVVCTRFAGVFLSKIFLFGLWKLEKLSTKLKAIAQAFS